MAHTSHIELAGRTAAAQTEVKVGELYYHWRNPGQHYSVLNVGVNEADEQIVVVYELQADKPIVWVRPLRGEDGWLTPVMQDDQEIPRFNRVNVS
jgi:hypothetical protein